MSEGWTIWRALSMTWRSSALPPISWSTLARLDLRRVPLPPAMMTIASFIETGYRVRESSVAGALTGRLHARRHGDLDVDRMHGAELEVGQRCLELRLIADHENRELRRVDVLVRDAFEIGEG